VSRSGISKLWRALVLGAIILAAFSFFTTARLFTDLSESSTKLENTTEALKKLGVENCDQNQEQDRRLADLIELSINARDPNLPMTEKQLRAKIKFEEYVRRVRSQPPCPPFPVE
jgi:hypothetical protein